MLRWREVISSGQEPTPSADAGQGDVPTFRSRLPAPRGSIPRASTPAMSQHAILLLDTSDDRRNNGVAFAATRSRPSRQAC